MRGQGIRLRHKIPFLRMKTELRTMKWARERCKQKVAMTDSHILGGIMFDYSTNADYNQ
jgi:hypothetical protein